MKRLDAIAAAKRWIIRSGIQIQAPRSAANGAFNAWYDAEERRFRYAYPEITGYGITALLYLNSLRADPVLIKKGCLAGDWVIRRALHPCGGIRPRDHYDRQERSLVFSFERQLVVAFDSGMVLFGLMTLYDATRRRVYLNAARRIGDFLLKAQRGSGLFYACYNPARKVWIDKPDKWSTQSGSYHAKLALGLLDLQRLTGQEKYRRGTLKACRAMLMLQLPSGRFLSYRSDKSTHMHPHLYSAEGMLMAGLTLKRPDLMHSAARAVRWTLSEQLPDGGLPCLVGERGLRNLNQRSDVLAQTLRLGALCYGLGLLPKSVLPSLAKLERKLRTYQVKTSLQKGGFRYGQELNGECREHVNFWCTAFALQALAMHEEVRSGRTPDHDFFI